jgi:antitoxin VapB
MDNQHFVTNGRWSEPESAFETPVRNPQEARLTDVYTFVYISRGPNMAIARLFKSGNSQTVRLPKKFRAKSLEVEIRRGNEIVLREKAGGMVRVLDLLAELPTNMFPKKRKDPQPQRRKGLCWVPAICSKPISASICARTGHQK